MRCSSYQIGVSLARAAPSAMPADQCGTSLATRTFFCEDDWLLPVPLLLEEFVPLFCEQAETASISARAIQGIRRM